MPTQSQIGVMLLRQGVIAPWISCLVKSLVWVLRMPLLFTSQHLIRNLSWSSKGSFSLWVHGTLSWCKRVLVCSIFIFRRSWWCLATMLWSFLSTYSVQELFAKKCLLKICLQDILHIRVNLHFGLSTLHIVICISKQCNAYKLTHKGKTATAHSLTCIHLGYDSFRPVSSLPSAQLSLLPWLIDGSNWLNEDCLVPKAELFSPPGYVCCTCQKGNTPKRLKFTDKLPKLKDSKLTK